MTTASLAIAETAYAKCIKASKRVRWDIDEDVIKGRDFDFQQTFYLMRYQKFRCCDF